MPNETDSRRWPAMTSRDALLPDWVIERQWYDMGFKTSTCICTDTDHIRWMGHAPYCVSRQGPLPDLRPDHIIEEEEGLA